MRTIRNSHRPRITLQQMERATGIHWSQLSKIETGERPADSDTVIAVVNVFTALGYRIELNDVLRKAGLDPVRDRPTEGKGQMTLSLSNNAGSGGEAATIHGTNERDAEQRHNLIEHLATTLPLLQGDAFDAAVELISELRKNREAASSPARSKGHREDGSPTPAHSSA